MLSASADDDASIRLAAFEHVRKLAETHVHLTSEELKPGFSLHQASFREAVITAYDGRCALSGRPEPLLLDAAHIVADGDERFGQAMVTNGIPLSKIHHAAFDAHLIGIDPDFRLHVSERLMSQKDGPMLEALKGLNGGTLHGPKRLQDRPDRDRLALRFERFRNAA